MREINNPPLLTSTSRDLQYAATSVKNIGLGRTLSSGMAETMVSELEGEIFHLQEKQMTVDLLRHENNYKEARADFIHRNAIKL